MKRVTEKQECLYGIIALFVVSNAIFGMEAHVNKELSERFKVAAGVLKQLHTMQQNRNNYLSSLPAELLQEISLFTTNDEYEKKADKKCGCIKKPKPSPHSLYKSS